MPARVAEGKKSMRGLWVALAAISLLLAFGIALLISVYDAGPILHGRVVQTLSNKFKSRVELGSFHVTVSHGFEVSGENLRIYGQDDPNSHQPGIQPLFSIADFNFHIGIWNVLKSPTHIQTVFVRGLAINIPPANDRQQISQMRAGNGKAKMFVDHFVCDHAELVINTATPGKLPLVFDIQNLNLDATAPGQALRFHADLANPKPVGMIHTAGMFGPWRPDKPQDTSVSGKYSFRDADLGTIRGIGGTLSSEGDYAGTLDRIVVDGTTDTPDFQVSRSGHALPLKTEFHAVVDAITGDTYLQPVRAKVAHSSLLASGFIVRVANPSGHRVNLKVDISSGRIEDLLLLGVRTDPPVMTGKVRLSTKFDLPSGEEDLSDRLKLSGTFQVSGAHFSSEKIQDKVGALSLKSQGKPKLAKTDASDDVLSNVGGDFALNQGVLSFSRLQFSVPGTQVSLSGRYSLDGNEFDFHGKARLQAKLSHMITGWKSILLKPVDPFFSKNGAGTELPVKITGTKSEPHFGLDFGHHNVRD